MISMNVVASGRGGDEKETMKKHLLFVAAAFVVGFGFSLLVAFTIIPAIKTGDDWFRSLPDWLRLGLCGGTITCIFLTIMIFNVTRPI